MAFNSSGECVVVIANCLTLNVTTPTLCAQCNTNYTLTTDRLHCYPLIVNCKYMNNDDKTKCDTCLTGTLTTSKNQCVTSTSITNCQYLNDTDTTKCDTCSFGFTLLLPNYSCGPFLANCQLSSMYNNQIYCGSCINGFMIVSSGL